MSLRHSQAEGSVSITPRQSLEGLEGDRVAFIYILTAVKALSTAKNAEMRDKTAEHDLGLHALTESAHRLEEKPQLTLPGRYPSL